MSAVVVDEEANGRRRKRERVGGGGLSCRDPRFTSASFSKNLPLWRNSVKAERKRPGQTQRMVIMTEGGNNDKGHHQALKKQWSFNQFWCNNGGGGGNFFKSKAVRCKVDRNTEKVILWFFCSTGGILGIKEFFPRRISHKNPGIHICLLLWALRICKNTGIQPYFGSVTVESVKFFHHFAFWRHGTRLATFFIAPRNCIFWGASFEPIKNLATLVPDKSQGFHGSPLYLCCTI